MVSLFGVSDASHEGNWLVIVQKRLELEQKPVETFLKKGMPGSKKQVLALNNAMTFYKNQFDELYNALMIIFKESDDWISLREYLIQNKKMLDDKYNQLRTEYITKLPKKRGISSTELSSYEAGVKDYYNLMMEALKKVVTDGQAKEVALRQKEIKAMKKQERQKKLGIEEPIRTEEK